MIKNIFNGKKKLSFYLIVIGVLLVGITLGSALLSSTLKVIGNSKISKNSWVIYFDDIDIAEDSAPNSNSNDNASISINGAADPTKQNIEFTAHLNDPGDFYEFTVYTVNDGTIDAEVESLEKSILTEEQQKYLDFDVTYDDGTPIQVCDILYHKGSTEGPNKRLVKAVVKYKKGLDVNDYPKDGVNLNLYFKINYKQRDKCEPLIVDTKYKLTIRPNGGKYEGRTSQVRKYLTENEEYVLSRPTRDLYNFNGWDVIDPETGGTYHLEPYEDKYKFTMGHEDVTIEAKWKEGDYVARIMDHYYTKVELAFDAVDGNNPSTGRPWENNTVWLIKDTEEVALNNARSNFTFNLDGHTLTGKVVNPSTGKISIVNGTIQGSTDVEESEKQRRIDEGLNPVPYVNNISGEAILNYGTLTLGKNDGTVEVENSISIFGSQYGIYNVSNSKFNFYDGFIQSKDAFGGLTLNYSTDGREITIAPNHFTFIDHRQEEGKDYQKVYLTPSPNRAVVKTTTVIPAYYYNLQDAIDTVIDTKNKNSNLTDNDYIIEAIRTFEAAYSINVERRDGIASTEENTRVFFDLKGYGVQTGETITNKGYFKIYNSRNTDSTLQISKTITNEGSLEINNIDIPISTDADGIVNKNKLKLRDVSISSHNAYCIKNIENGTLDFNKEVTLRSYNKDNSARADQYALYNSGTKATLNNGTIYGLYNVGTITISGSDTEYIPVWNYTNNNGDKVYLKSIYNSGTVIMNDGIVTTDINTPLIDNSGTFTFNNGTLTSEYLVVSNSGTFNVKGNEVVSSRTAIQGGTVNVDGGNVRTSSTNAITNSTVNVKNGEVIAEDGVAIGNGSSVNVMGGTVIGTTYGVYGGSSSINVSSGTITAPIAANVYNATVSGGNVTGSEYAIIASNNTNISGGTITSPKNAVVTNNLTMTGGTVDSTNEIGITINSNGNITGGEIYGGTYGVDSKGTLTLGTDDGTISSTSPLLEGELLGLNIQGNTTNFYDGILKGQNDGYEGNITGLPLGGVVGEGSEDRGGSGIYNTDFVSSFDSWLRIGDTPYNTLNAASQAVGENEEVTVVVTRDADIKFSQKIIDDNSNKKIILDLNGHKLTTTQNITNYSNLIIIDSSTGSNPYDDKGDGPSGIKILKNTGIINYNRIEINAGRYESLVDQVFYNKISSLGDNDSVIKGIEINNATFNVPKSIISNGIYEDGRDKPGLVRINGINVETSYNTITNNQGIIIINGAKNNTTGEYTTVINATNYAVSNSGSTYIFGGKIEANNTVVNGNGYVYVGEDKNVNLDDDNYVASTELLSVNSNAIYVDRGSVRVDNGNIKSLNNTAIVAHSTITINGGTITGTRGVKNEEWCGWTYCAFDPIYINGGTITGLENEGIYLTGGYGYFNGGLIIGQTDGIRNYGDAYLGQHGGVLSITQPEVRAKEGYAFNNYGHFRFYDGILKGKKKENIANSSHNGMIQVVEDATQVKRDYEYINNVYYETEYLESQGDWLEIEGKDRYNTINKACDAASDGDTIKVIADTHVAFEQVCSGNKTLTFDENGHSVSLTQKITFNGNITFVDSVGNGLLNNIRGDLIQTNGTIKIESGTYTVDDDVDGHVFIINGPSKLTGGTIQSDRYAAIYNTSEMEIDDEDLDLIIKSKKNYAIDNRGILTFKHGSIESYGGIYSENTFILEDGTIKGTNSYSYTSIGGTNQIKGGKIINDYGVSAYMYCSSDTTITGGKIISTVNNAIDISGGSSYNCSGSKLHVNGGEISGKTNGISASSYTYLEVNDGIIKGTNNNGINVVTCNARLNGGVIEGGTYGVYSYHEYENTTTQLGENDGSVSIDSPVLKGELYGLYIDRGILNYYDGVLKGQTEGYLGQITNIADRTQLYDEDDEVIDNVEYQVIYLLSEKVIVKNIDKPSGDLSYTEYGNLQEAFDAASNGDRLVLVDNAPIYYSVSNNKNISLDMNGYRISTNKPITNSGDLEIKNTGNRESKISTSSAMVLITNTGNLKIDNITLTNTSSSRYVVQSSGDLSFNKTKINSIYGINSSNKLNITDSEFACSHTAIYSTGLLNINKGTYTGNNYSIYSDASSNVTIKEVNINGTYYNSGNNTTLVEDSILNGQLQNRSSNATVKDSTFNRETSNNGTLLIDTCNINDSITNSGNLTIKDSNMVTTGNDNIQNSGTININNSRFSLHSSYCGISCPFNSMHNTGTMNVDNSIFTVDDTGMNAIESRVFYNTGTLNISNNTNINVGNDNNRSYTAVGIYTEGNGTSTIVDSNMKVKGASTAYGFYLNNNGAKVYVKTGSITAQEQETGVIETGRIEVYNSTTSYGAYINRGTFELGDEDGSGDETAIVSTIKPLISAVGSSRGIAIKKVNGLFNFYDGRLEGSRFAKPETTSKVERNYEVTTYVDSTTGHEFAYLEYMQDDYQHSNAKASITIGLDTTYYPSVREAVRTYLDGLAHGEFQDGVEITLLQSNVELYVIDNEEEIETPITIPSNANIKLNLNGRSITTQFVNNGTFEIYNGSVQNFDKEAIINNGTLTMGINDGTVSSTNIRVISEVEAIKQNGTLIMYDGYLEGNPSITGEVTEIADFSRIYTVNDTQSEKKYLQSLDENSIRNRETALFIEIDPKSGFYNGVKGKQTINKFFEDVVYVKDPTKNGCTFLGWDIEGATLEDIDSSETDLINQGYKYKFTVGLTDVKLTAKWQISELAVAKIGEEYYNSVSDAIMEAKENDTIELIKDVTEHVSNNKNVTLDLGGYTLTGEFINTGILRVINGTIENTEGIGIWNKKTLILGENDASTPSMDSVKIIGTTIGIKNDGGLKFYDGYVEGKVALDGDVDAVPQGYFLYIEHNTEKDCQREYLIGNPKNAVAITKNTAGEESTVQYFFSLQDAIDTATISGKEIFIIKDFIASYPLSITENANIKINLEGHNIQFGTTFTNNGTLKIYDTTEPDEDNPDATKGSITAAKTLTNNGNLTVEDVTISQSKSENTITNNSTGTLNISNNATIVGLDGYAVNNNGTLNLGSEYTLRANRYALRLGSTGNELTINSGTIYGISSEKQLTIEDGATIIAGASDSAGIVPKANLIINGGTITSTGNNAIYSAQSGITVTINGGTLTATNGLYCDGGTANYIFNGGTITATGTGVYMRQSNCNFEMNGGTITASGYGLNVENRYHTIKITDGELKSTGNYGIRLYQYYDDGCNYTQTGGKVIGATHGLYTYYSRINISGGEVKTTSSSRDHYAMYSDYDVSATISGDAFINAPNASGIRSWYNATIKDNAKIYAGASSARGIEFGGSYTITIQDNVKIETPGESAIGIHFINNSYNPTLNINGGQIISGSVGIHTDTNDYSKTINVNSGRIVGENYGIYHVGPQTTVNIGNKNNELSEIIPYISGGLYGIYKGNGYMNFYNGRLRGYTAGYSNSFNAVREAKDIAVEYEEYHEADRYITFSVNTASVEPVSKVAKLNDGYAKITYIDEDNGTCVNGSSEVFTYIGEEDIYTVPCTGKYKLEVWGAAGGGDAINTTVGSRGGAGGYSVGEIELTMNEKLYINVGGKGAYGTGTSSYGGPKGGYNGGGNGGNSGSGSGGGATHIALASGLLKNLSNDRDKVLIVAGGGGGADNAGGTYNGDDDGTGGSGGGYIGGSAYISGSLVSRNRYNASTSNDGGCGMGGTQDKGYAFGQGESVTYNTDTGGAGGGWYGGYVTNNNNGGAAGGSGYVGNSRITNGEMYGYNVKATPGRWVNNYLIEKDNFLQVDDESFNSINAAVKYIVDNKNGEGKILLMKNASVSDSSTIDAGTNIEFDLQGFTITMTKVIVNQGTFKVTDSSTNKTGLIDNTKENAIQNRNSLTIDGAKIRSGNGSSAISATSSYGNITVKDSIITGAYHGITCDVREDITIENSTITASNSGIYFGANSNKLNIISGTINANNVGLYFYRAGNSTVTINDLTLNSTNQGIYEYDSSGLNITIDYAEITSTNSNAMQFESYSSKTMTIRDGKFKGADYGLKLRYINLNMTSGTIETTNTSRDRYALYVYDYTTNLSNVEIKANNASGILQEYGTLNITNSEVNVNGSSGYGINNYSATTNINTGTIINSTGNESSYGILARGSGTTNINAGYIYGNHSGIYMQDTSKVNIYGGEVIGNFYGVRETASDNSLVIGKQADELSITTPKLQGVLAIYRTAGKTYYYNGLLSSVGYGYNEPFDLIRSQSEITDDLSPYEEIDQDTIITKEALETPTSETAKIGNGYAKLTYIDEDTQDCTNGDTYTFDYTGEEKTFTTPCTGKYKVEVWGAQGGYSLCDGNKCGYPGYGGYSTGEIELTQDEVLYINVGGQGGNGSKTSCSQGGYNGGGKGANDGGGCGTANDDEAAGAGGGATHIATKSGLLSTLDQDIDKIIIVAGGGGGSSWYSRGGSGGGTKGGITVGTISSQATQLGGYAFGKGQDGSGGRQGSSCGYGVSPSCNGVAGGGGGFYGGFTQDREDIESGTGGSGYIGNTRLLNGKMYGFNLNGSYIYNYFVTKENFLMVDDQEFNNINSAVAYIKEFKNNEGTIKLMKDATTQEKSTFDEGTNIVFDLQNHTLTTSLRLYNKGTLKIINGTIKDIRDDVVQNENNLTVENVTLTAASGYTSIYGNKENGKIYVKDSTLNGGNHGVILNTQHELKYENSTMTVGDTGINMRVANSKVDIISGTINSSNIGIYIYRSANSKINIKDVTINSTNQGIYEYDSSGLNITIDYAEITSRNSNAMQFESYSGKTMTIKDGKFKGADYGLKLRYINLTMTSGTIETTNTSRDRYALYVYDYTTNLSNVKLISNKASGIYQEYGTLNISKSDISANNTSSYGIHNYYATTNVYEGTNITAGGSSSIGIYGRYYGTINMYDGYIDSGSVGIQMETNNATNVYGGRIVAGNYGIYETNSSNSLNMGNKNNILSIHEPYVEGGLYGIYKTNGTMNFYNGRLKGKTTAYSGTFANIREGYEVFEGPDGVSLEMQSRNTISTDTTSSTPDSNTPKIGNGYAKITYKKSNYIESKYDDTLINTEQDVYNYDYNGSFHTFEAPQKGDYKIELWGAQGGTLDNAIGGKGAYTSGIIHLNKGEKLYIYVGSQGGTSAGYNGGGSPSNSNYGRGGGGATDVRLVQETWYNTKGLSSRIMVAGGGGSAYKYYTEYVHNGANAGTLVGESGTAYNTCISTGGTQTSGGTCSLSTSVSGSFGRGGNGQGSAGGGGAGYYGGSGRYDKSGSGSGAGGGSSYISGYTGSIAIASETDRSPRLGSNNQVCEEGTTDNTCSIHYSGKVFSDTFMAAGDEAMPDYTTGEQVFGNTGNGHARITKVITNKVYVKLVNEQGNISELEYNKNDTLGNVSDPTTTRTDIVFDGWYLEPTYNTLVDSNYVVEGNINLYAKWLYKSSVGDSGNVLQTTYTDADILNPNSITTTTVKEFNYSGSEETYTIPRTGYYLLETWGAQGGDSSTSYAGGYGGYSTGKIKLNQGDIIYVNVGGQGSYSDSESVAGGYNGGGYGQGGRCGGSRIGASGGGATHIALKSGILSSFDTNENGKADSDEIDDLLIVAGGGGGAFNYAAVGPGGSGGGAIGGKGYYTLNGHSYTQYPTGGTQVSGGYNGNSYQNYTAVEVGKFGKGGDKKSQTCNEGSGGGGGFYGGGYGHWAPGAGGSGYIGNSNLTNKHMICYNCGNSTDTNSFTTSIDTSERATTDAISDNAKKGNGYAKVTFLYDEGNTTLELMHDYGTLTNNQVSIQIGSEIGDLEEPTVSDPNISFRGWYYEPSYRTKVKSTDIILDNTRVFAKFVTQVDNCNLEDNETFEYDFTGTEKTFTAACSGKYILEVWGAQGGSAKYNSYSYVGGYGGYSYGEIDLQQNEKLYINVGGKGTSVNYKQSYGSVEYDTSTGYNGGGYASYAKDNSSHGGGGGATHIATSSGLLSTLSNNKSSVLIVAGGGGGASAHYTSPNYAGRGGSGGGYIAGNGNPASNYCYNYGLGGTEFAAGGYSYCSYDGRDSRNDNPPANPTFGKGSNYTTNTSSVAYAGGGGGYYGGQSGWHAPGGGGSGYTGNTRLYNTVMYGYNVKEKNGGQTNVAYLIKAQEFVKNINKPSGEETFTMYTNLQDAINDANDGDTLELTHDGTLTYNVTIENKEITLDLKGKNILTTKQINVKDSLHIVNTSNISSKIKTINTGIFITGDTNTSLTIDNIIIESASAIKMNSGSRLNITNTNIQSSGTAVENLGTMTISNSTINGNTYAVYDNSSSTNSITNCTLSASTAVYANGTGILNVIDNTINGSVTNNNSSQKVTIDVDTKSSITLNGLVTNVGSMNINKTNISVNRSGDNSGDTYAINNSGVLKLENSNVTLNSSNRWYYSHRRAVSNSGTLNSKNNTYKLTYSNSNYYYDYLYGIYNTSIMSSTNDSIEIKGSRRAYGIYNNSTHNNTITNINIKNSNIEEYDYGIVSDKSDIVVEGITVESYNNKGSSNGIVLNSPATITIRNANIGLHDNATSYGIRVKDASVTLESGQIDSRGTNAYGVTIDTGTFTQGIYDGSGTDTADVSITNPSITATGTTKGIGVSMGTGTYKFYDGIVTGSTSAYADGDIVGITEYRYHAEFSADNKSCILRFDM